MSCSASLQVSDLLREQLLLRSEISDDCDGGGDTPSRRSSRSPSSQRGEDGEQRGGGTYRSSINITPATPPRPNAHAEETEEQGDEEETKEQAEREAGLEVGPSELEGAVGGAKMDNLQQLIKQVIGGAPQEVLLQCGGKRFLDTLCETLQRFSSRKMEVT